MENHCPRCQVPTREQDKFCAECGWNLRKPVYRTVLGIKGLLLIGVVGCIAWGAAWTIQERLAGNKPTSAVVASTDHSAVAGQIQDPVLRKLAEDSAASPGDINKLRSLASALLAKLNSTAPPPRAMVMQTINALSEILKIDPTDADALIAMANISYDSGVFVKAVMFYARYLEVKPDNHDMRAKYASALTLTGRVDEAVKQLKTVLEKEPEHFHASVYLAVAYAQTGQKEEFLAMSEKAMARAPADERERITGFMNDMRERLEQKKEPGGKEDSRPGGPPRA